MPFSQFHFFIVAVAKIDIGTQPKQQKSIAKPLHSTLMHYFAFPIIRRLFTQNESTQEVSQKYQFLMCQ
jgi:hypothetical protein